MPIDEADIEEEQAHFAKVIATFQQYASYAVRTTLQHELHCVELPRLTPSTHTAYREQPP